MSSYVKHTSNKFEVSNFLQKAKAYLQSKIECFDLRISVNLTYTHYFRGSTKYSMSGATFYTTIKRKMELMNSSFFTGIGIGICIGISIYSLKKYLGMSSETTRAIKKFTSKSEYKVVLVVRTDLNMSKGKIAAQCGHAAVGVFEKALKRDPEGLKSWQMTGQAKVALKTDSVDEIRQIADNAKKMGIITSLIRDAGRTQIAPNSITVLGVGPAPKDIVDKVTGHLKLL